MDQEPKFSPGPWAWHGPDHNIHVAQAEDANMRVCFLTSNGPTEANAHLIASAPDLYASLYELVAARREVSDTFLDRDANDRAINRLIAAEKAAADVLWKAIGVDPEEVK